MNPKTTLYLSIAVLLGLAGVWYANSSKPQAGPPPGVKKVFDPRPEGIKRLELAEWGKPAMVFEKTDTKWNLLEPIKGPADANAVDAVINKLLDLNVDRTYAEGAADRPSEDIVKLQQPAWLAKMTDKDGKTQTLRVGGPVLMATQTYVQLEGDKRIFVVKSDLSSEIQRGLDNYREKRVSDFIANEVVRVEISGAANMTLAKTDGKWSIEKPTKARANAQEVTQLLVSLSNARVEKFVDDTPGSGRAYGLSKPRLSIKLDVEHEKKIDRPDPMKVLTTQPASVKEKYSVTYQFGGKAQEETVFARLDDKNRPAIFTLPKYLFDNVVGAAEKVRDKKILAGEPLRATMVRVTGPDGTVSLEKKDGAWHITGTNNAADFAAVDDVLKTLSTLTATAFENPGSGIAPDYGFDKGTKIELQTEGSLEAMQVTIGGPTRAGTGAYVRNDREGSISVIKADTAASLRVTPMAFVDRKLLSFDRNQVVKIELQSDGMTRVLDKRGFNWEMTAPKSGPVEMKVVLDMLADVSALAARNIVGTQADLSKFGLDQPAVRAKFVVQPPALTPPPSTSSAPASAPAPITPPPVTHSLIASRHGDKAYVFIEGGSRIAEVDDKIFRDLTAEPFEHKVVKVDVAKVTGIELAYPGRTMNLTKKGQEWLLEGEPGFRGDVGKVMAIANAARDLITDHYVVYSGGDLKQYKLDAPAIHVTLQVEGASPVELRISSEGPPNDEAKRRYATAGDSGAVFLIGGSDAAKFDKQVKDLQQGEGAPMPPPGGMPPGMGGMDE